MERNTLITILFIVIAIGVLLTVVSPKKIVEGLTNTQLRFLNVYPGGVNYFTPAVSSRRGGLPIWV